MSRDLARILVPTDFSSASNGAVDFAKTLALKFGAVLHLVHVMEDVASAQRSLPAVQPLLDAQLTDDDRAQLRTTLVVLAGPVATSIVDYAIAHNIDLIVMGTQRHQVLGLVVDGVVRMSPCPVLTVKEDRRRSRRINIDAEFTVSAFV